jgi:hypothetical protein
MVQGSTWFRTGLWVGIGLTAVAIACKSSRGDAAKGAGNPAGPTAVVDPSPVPTPTPQPTPTPKPSPSVSKNGIHVEVVYYGNQECKRGVGPTGNQDLRVGCSVEVRALRKDPNGNEVPERFTGNDTAWHIREGRANVTLPWDENTWRRWLTAVEPGHYRISMDLKLRDGEVITGELEGDSVP